MPRITIDFTDAQAARFSDAWEELYNNKPTMTDVKKRLVDELKAIVSHGESAKAERIKPAPAPFEVL
jgi:hypothetical protein